MLPEEQVGKVVLAIRKKTPEVMVYDEEGNVSVDLESIPLEVAREVMLQIIRWEEEGESSG